MAGIYIHIPFCQTRCIYCDFFSSVSIDAKDRYIDALSKEIGLQRNYLQGEQLQTIYFGGGTPSLLNMSDFKKLFDALSFEKKLVEEITLEANPDDITPDYLNILRSFPFNRISLGIQSFNSAELRFLNRRHDAKAAIRAVKKCQSAGFENISIDLIYGLPGQDMVTWKNNLQQVIDLNVPHISAYHLIYEENTELYRLFKSGKITPVDEELSLEMFGEMIDRLHSIGFEQYEISNFARKGYYSRHNSSYWNGTPYLGVGASAHSYNGKTRQWNVSSIKKYIDAINRETIPAEVENIDEQTAYNDYIITRMRTSRGINPEEITGLFGEKVKTNCLKHARKYLLNGLLEEKENCLRLTRKGIFISDSIMSDLLIVSYENKYV